MRQITADCTTPPGDPLEGGPRVVALGAGGLDVAEPVAVVEVARALDAGGDELPGVALVRPVLGLQAVRGAEVRPGGLDVTGVVQMLTQLELGGGLRYLRRAGRRALYDLFGREGVLARRAVLDPVAQRLHVVIGVEARDALDLLEHVPDVGIEIIRQALRAAARRTRGAERGRPVRAPVGHGARRAPGACRAARPPP